MPRQAIYLQYMIIRVNKERDRPNSLSVYTQREELKKSESQNDLVSGKIKAAKLRTIP